MRLTRSPPPPPPPPRAESNLFVSDEVQGAIDEVMGYTDGGVTSGARRGVALASAAAAVAAGAAALLLL